MVATHRTGMWGFIILLGALAFLRSLAPEHTEKAVRNLMKTSNIPNVALEEEKRHLKEIQDEIKRERIALERLKEKFEQNAGTEEVERTEEQSFISNAAAADDSSTKTEAAWNDGAQEDTGEESIEQNSHSAHENAAEQEPERHESTGDQAREETHNPDHDVELVELADGECPVVVVPEYSKSGLGTQIEHVWTSLSVTLAVRNACAVLPPVVTNSGEEDVEIVPFQEIFDLNELGRTGLRLLPLSVCKDWGVSHVFDDNGAESAIVKNFVSYVTRSHPSLAEQTALVHDNTQAHRFPPIEETEGDVNRVAAYMSSKRGEGQGRECIGFGRMRSAMAFNLDVVEHFQSAPSITDYVSSKYLRMNETLFVKLRWNQAHCDEKRNEDGTVCILSGEIIPTDDYVKSIAYAATTVGASRVYISAPAHVPEEVSVQLSSKLKPIDPVVLDIGSDFFTASVIEWEMAVRSRAFVSDGGAWGVSVQESRRMHYPHLFKEGYHSLLMVEEWRNAGSPTELPILMASYIHEENNVGEPVRPAANPGDHDGPAETVPGDDQPAEVPKTSASETGEGSQDPGTTNATPEQPELGAGNDIPPQTGPETANAGTEVTADHGADAATPAQADSGYVNAEANGDSSVLPAQPENGPVNAEPEEGQGTMSEVHEEMSAEARPVTYVPPHSYTPSEESDHHLFPDGELPERKAVDQPQAITEASGHEGYVHDAVQNSSVVRIVSGDGGDSSPHRGREGEQSP